MDTSPFAYEHVLRVKRRKSASLSTGFGGAMAGARLQHNIYGPLVWLYNLILRLTAGEVDITDVVAGPQAYVLPLDNERFFEAAGACRSVFKTKVKTKPKPRGRGTYSLRKRKQMMDEIIRFQRLMYIEKVIYGGLTRMQRLQKQVRISILGPRRSYGLDFRQSQIARVADRALIRILDWRVPVPAATLGGLSLGQLPPD